MKEEKEFYSIGRGSLNLNGKFYYGLDYAITDFMRSLEEENKSLQSQLKAKEEAEKEFKKYVAMKDQQKELEEKKKDIENQLLKQKEEIEKQLEELNIK